ncbi:MAG: hypothetical protein WC856_02295 [Methylococcaceae bacterium]|jgi:hypothetical protein
MNNQKTALYRHFSSDGTLLYVGISLSAINRLSQHKTSGWHTDIAKVDIEHFDNRISAMNAEEQAIKIEKPKFNIAHNQENKSINKRKVKKIGSKDQAYSDLLYDEKVFVSACVDENGRIPSSKITVTVLEFSALLGISIDDATKRMFAAVKTLQYGHEVRENRGDDIEIRYRKLGWLSYISYNQVLMDYVTVRFCEEIYENTIVC